MNEEDKLLKDMCRINLSYALECLDAIDSMMMDTLYKMRRFGDTMKQEYKRRWNMMMANAKSLRCSMKQVFDCIYTIEDSDETLNDSDFMYDILLLILDRCGEDKDAAKMIKHMIHQCPSKMHFYDLMKH